VVPWLLCVLIASPQTPLLAAAVRVRHREGTTHGFLVVRSVDGQLLASGDSIQTVTGDRVSSQLTLHFKDGSLHEETTEFSQEAAFRLISDHLIQEGPSFPKRVDARIDVAAGRVSVRENEGKDHESHLQLPEDVANGLLITILKNLPESNAEATVALVTTSSNPTVINLRIRAAGADPFSAGGPAREALHFVGHTEIGGLVGVFAHITGKQPPDVNFWIVGGKAPAFVKFMGPLYEGGPVWSVELVAPKLASEGSGKVPDR